MILPVTRKAHLNLKGLRVNAAKELGRDFFSWGDVSGAPNASAVSLWLVHAETGEPLRHNGRNLHLRVSSGYEARLALRAQKRWLRRVWRNGELRIVEKCRPASRFDYGFLLVFLAAMFTAQLYTVPAVWKMWQADSIFSVPAAYWISKVVSLFFLGLSALPIMLGFLILRSMPLREIPVRIDIDSDCIRVFFADGRTTIGMWSKLSAVKRSVLPLTYCLVFNEVDVIRLHHLSNRTKRAIDVIEQSLLPEHVMARKRCARRLPIRIGLWWVCAGVFGGVLIETIIIEPRLADPGIIVLSIFLFAGVLSVGMLVFESNVRRWFERKRRARNRLRRMNVVM